MELIVKIVLVLNIWGISKLNPGHKTIKSTFLQSAKILLLIFIYFFAI